MSLHHIVLLTLSMASPLSTLTSDIHTCYEDSDCGLGMESKRRELKASMLVPILNESLSYQCLRHKLQIRATVIHMG